MKKVRISLALVALLISSIGAFAFKNQKAQIPCVSGPASDSSQCGDKDEFGCCITANGENFRFPLN